MVKDFQIPVFIFYLGLLIISGCTTSNNRVKPEETKENQLSTPRITPMNTSNSQIKIPVLEKWSNRLGNSLDEIKILLQPNEEQIASGRSYQGMKDLTWMHNPTIDPVHCYFHDEKLVMVFLEGKEAIGDLSTDDLFSLLGPVNEQNQLRSRAGGRSMQCAYPLQGITFSAAGTVVEFVELFPPISMEEYLSGIYQDPGPFRR